MFYVFKFPSFCPSLSVICLLLAACLHEVKLSFTPILSGISAFGFTFLRKPRHMHCLQEGHLVSDPIPSISKQRRISQLVQNRRVLKKELHHCMRLCYKPFIHKERAVEGNIVPNDGTQSCYASTALSLRVEPVFASVNQEMWWGVLYCIG